MLLFAPEQEHTFVRITTFRSILLWHTGWKRNCRYAQISLFSLRRRLRSRRLARKDGCLPPACLLRSRTDFFAYYGTSQRCCVAQTAVERENTDGWTSGTAEEREQAREDVYAGHGSGRRGRGQAEIGSGRGRPALHSLAPRSSRLPDPYSLSWPAKSDGKLLFSRLTRTNSP